MRIGQGYDAHKFKDGGKLILGGVDVPYDSYKGIDSRILLKEVMIKVREGGMKLGNADITIIAQEPKLALHIQSMREILAADMSTALNNVSVKATTTEKMGFTGRGEGIAVQAVVLLL